MQIILLEIDNDKIRRMVCVDSEGKEHTFWERPEGYLGQRWLYIQLGLNKNPEKLTV